MIIVCSLSDLENVCESIKPKYVISVIDPGYAPKTPNGVSKHLKLGFDDIIEISSDNKIFRLNEDEIPQVLPGKEHVNSIIDFTSNYDEKDDIVIHCWCGVSRSMATATYLLCRENKLNIESNIKYIRNIAPHANPNKLLISHFEKNLNVGSKITSSFKKFPHTKSYDCSSNFAPVTLFNIKEMKNFS
ncbi:dual specificity protein phosphatase family protein [Pelagibacteraceae bacterium]|nr:dual specificity protein phosphatase family protein [Pelagibacteraceae bacterium]